MAGLVGNLFSKTSIFLTAEGSFWGWLEGSYYETGENSLAPILNSRNGLSDVGKAKTPEILGFPTWESGKFRKYRAFRRGKGQNSGNFELSDEGKAKTPEILAFPTRESQKLRKI